MIEQDTVKLLRECDAGIKMGVSAIDDVLNRVRSNTLREQLADCKVEHEKIRGEVQDALHRFHDSGKNPNIFASSMSKMKTAVMMGFKESDKTVADLITDGCNMGVKSLNRYLNQYKAADETAKDLTKRLSKLEEDLVTDIRTFL